MSESNERKNPECKVCHKSGASVQFLISSKYGFGTYCVECEKDVQKWEQMLSGFSGFK